MTDSKADVHWRDLFKQAFGLSFWLFVAVAVVTAGICYTALGPTIFADAIAQDFDMLGTLLPRVAAAQIVAGLIWVLVPRERLSQFMNKGRGRLGLLVATFVGIITPGGPMSAYPFLAMLAGSGADRGILVAYITSWALLGMQRIIVWDIPLMGLDFSLLRLAISLPLPIIAGIIARRLPFDGVVVSTALADPHVSKSEKIAR